MLYRTVCRRSRTVGNMTNGNFSKGWMTVRPSPTVRARRLASELAQRRQAAGLTLEAASAATRGEVSPVTFQRAERGARIPRPGDLRLMLAAYQTSPAEVEWLVSLAREARQRGWWHPYQGAIRPSFEPYIGFETEATAIREYASELVPGLLQTEAYYRTVLATNPPAVDAEQIVALRKERQARFQEEDWSYRAVLNEAVVRRPVGGADVTRDQFAHLLELAGRPNVTIQVLPFAAGAHPAMAGSFTLFQFQGLVPDIAFVEHQAGSLYLDDGDETPYIRMYEHLIGMASSPADSAALIRDARASLP
jgi:transcriptional regulator with XRE-family HTH domain